VKKGAPSALRTANSKHATTAQNRRKTQRERIQKVGREALGFERLRPGQREAIEALLQGHDTLAVLPTGAGKSAIYQIAGEMMPGPTIVVSPLIALQRDQVESINESDAGNAAALNSTQRPVSGRKPWKNSRTATSNLSSLRRSSSTMPNCWSSCAPQNLRY
jgi:ATP-dependent DNA helicase RecQ